MIELPLVFIAGLLGSSHCIGMCGGFALLVGMSAGSWQHNLLAQLVYSAGRIFTYAVLGCGAGYLGMTLTKETALWGNAPALLCLAAGLFLIVQGLSAAGVRLWETSAKPAAGGCLAGSLFRGILKRPGLQSTFLAGLLTGFLPCGLVYAFLSLAASTGDLGRGMATMAVFGLGTVPLMVATGAGASLLSLVARQRLLHVAAWCVVLTGAITVARGAGYVQLSPEEPAAGCPMCEEAPSLPVPVPESNENR